MNRVELLDILMAFYRPRVYRVVFTFALLLSLISCTNDDSDSGTVDSGGSISVESSEFTGTTDSTGRAIVTLELKEGAPSFQTVAFSPAGQLRIISLADESGDLLFDSEASIDNRQTTAQNFQASPVTLNMPLFGKKKIEFFRLAATHSS